MADDEDDIGWNDIAAARTAPKQRGLPLVYHRPLIIPILRIAGWAALLGAPLAIAALGWPGIWLAAASVGGAVGCLAGAEGLALLADIRDELADRRRPRK